MDLRGRKNTQGPFHEGKNSATTYSSIKNISSHAASVIPPLSIYLYDRLPALLGHPFCALNDGV